MRTIGLAISHKENESRRALIPDDVALIKHRDQVYIEAGYGDVLGFNDADYERQGIRVASREEVLKKDIICDPKIGDAEYLGSLNYQTIFGWMHAVQNRDITDKLIAGHITAYAWEDMFEGGRHCFWRNNEIAGEAAVFHAFMSHGVFPYNKKVAVLGRGNSARGAVKMLNHLGADVLVYDRRTEHLFRNELGDFDVIVNAILWDTNRKDHIVYRADLAKMKQSSMIIDVSCDRNGGIETSVPTTIDDPTYMVDGVRHYVVDHTPSLFYKTTTESLSAIAAPYFDQLIEGVEDDVLKRCKIFQDGNILDPRIIEYQNR
ncbi:MAG: N(5)-(carboxyethyl)ornithine synthase [Rikenellaceae bacterium]|jgi:N5-(carboxyethyl)ornithine synthase|nr:N(5)-(carboxyethyl)ornithine synthase [Rikenellaceae bacterium]